MFFFIFFDISSLLLRYITPAIPRSSCLDLSKNILKNIDSYLNFRTLVFCFISNWSLSRGYFYRIEEMTEHNSDAACGEGSMTERNSSLPGIVRTDGEGTRRGG